MGDLSTKRRNKLPTRDFAGPDRSYPVNDRAHAANAKARASQMEHEGKLSPGVKAAIDRKADRVLDRHDGGLRHRDLKDRHHG